MARPENRIGLNINLGFGFESFPMYSTSNGRESSISFGGGYAFGFKYGHEFNRHFDLAFDVNYQFSELRPNLKNAHITFKRGIVSITPSYIIPIAGGDAMRLKFGGGMDYFWGNGLKINGSEVPGGFDDNWRYKNSIGFHLNLIFELNISERWSVSYGLKWYNVNYDFKSGYNSYPIDKKLSNPDGSGLDFLLGIFHHF